MTKQELADACLRVLSNRCRNLRKTIDRAKTWEQAVEKGATLNDEQLASIRSVPKKEALLVELQEILKKQTVVTQKHIAEDAEKAAKDPVAKENIAINANAIHTADKSTPSSSKDSATQSDCSAPGSQSVEDAPSAVAKVSPTSLDHKLSNGDAISTVTQTDRDDSKTDSCHLSDQTNILPTSTVNTLQTLAHGEQLSAESHNLCQGNHISSGSHPITVPKPNHGQQRIPNSSAMTSVDGISPDSSHLDTLSNTCAQTLYTTNNNQNPLLTTTHISKIVHELEEKHSKDLEEIKTACVQAVLNLFHVSDFLKQPGSRESVMAYFSTMDARQVPRLLTDLDIDILCYFHVMLTSPNGYVPHSEAVDVSTAHCLEYLKASNSEAFKGTTYAALAEIVHVVATCPVMMDRGREQNLTPQYVEDPSLLHNI